MYEALLFLHVLSAFALMVTVVMFSAFALGAVRNGRLLLVSNVLWGIGGMGTLIFGIWLAIYVKGYHVWDGWVIAAIVLWLVANAFGGKAQAGFAESADEAKQSQAALMHWLRSAVVLALLVVMIYKPGA